MFNIVAADLEQQIIHLSIKTVLISAVIITVCTIIAALLKNKKKYGYTRLPLFLGIAGTMAVSFVILMSNTVYLNTRAESRGPVHWHSDIEFWACGSELNLRDPVGFLSNKIGSATYHEHNDKRMHLEGVVVARSEDASLTKFMRLTGGYLANDGVGIPLSTDSTSWLVPPEKQDADRQTNDFTALNNYIVPDEEGAVLELWNATSTCTGSPAELQVFAYRYNGDSKTYTQTKMDKPTDYVMRDESTVPPGDCVIVEFDAPKNTTDKLCLQYGLRDNKRCVEYGVKEYSADLCNAQYVDPNGGTQ